MQISLLLLSITLSLALDPKAKGRPPAAPLTKAVLQKAADRGADYFRRSGNCNVNAATPYMVALKEACVRTATAAKKPAPKPAPKKPPQPQHHAVLSHPTTHTAEHTPHTADSFTATHSTHADPPSPPAAAFVAQTPASSSTTAPPLLVDDGADGEAELLKWRLLIVLAAGFVCSALFITRTLIRELFARRVSIKPAESALD